MDGNNMNQVNDYTYEAGTYEEPTNGGSNALAIIALICAILSLVCCLCYGSGMLPGIAGIICGALGKSRCPKAGMAKTAMIISIVSVVLNVIVGIVMGIFYGAAIFTGMESSGYYY